MIESKAKTNYKLLSNDAKDTIMLVLVSIRKNQSGGVVTSYHARYALLTFCRVRNLSLRWVRRRRKMLMLYAFCVTQLSRGPGSIDKGCLKIVPKSLIGKVRVMELGEKGLDSQFWHSVHFLSNIDVGSTFCSPWAHSIVSVIL